MINIRQFFGEIPRSDPGLLPAGHAVKALNCDLSSGALEPLDGVTSVQDVGAATQTVYKMDGKFLTWDTVVDVARAMVADSGHRISFTGDGYPKDTNASLALSGSSPFPTTVRRLGIPAPTNVPALYLDGTPGDDTVRSCSYAYTVVGKWEDGSVVESGPSNPTGVFDVKDGISVRLEGFEIPTVDGVYVTHFRIYRLNSGDNSSEFQLVTEISKTQGSYTDTVSDGDLGEALPTDGWTDPQDGLSGLISTSHGLLFGFSGNTIYPSEVFTPYAFPAEYSLPTESEIVALGYTGSMVFILTQTCPFMLLGQAPEILQLKRLGYQQPCMSARSVANVPGGIVYSSPDGLFSLNESGQGSLITQNIFTKKQWKALSPETLIGVYYDDAYFGFFAGTTDGLRLDLNTGQYTPLSMPAAVHGAHYCPEDDTLYLIQTKDAGREIVSWGTGAAFTQEWKSREYRGYGWYSAAMVEADFSAGPVTFNLYVDGIQTCSKSITNNDVFALPADEGNTFHVEVIGQGKITEVLVGESVSEIVEAII